MPASTTATTPAPLTTLPTLSPPPRRPLPPLLRLSRLPSASPRSPAPPLLPPPAAGALVTNTRCTTLGSPIIEPRATLSMPLPILSTAIAFFRAMKPAPSAVTPSTSGEADSVTRVRERATHVRPWAAISVAGRMASPMARMLSSTACPISAHICAEVSRRSARFLSRMPVASLASVFSFSYKPRLAA